MTAMLEIDEMSMDRINPYTATETFGISYNGGHKSTDALPWMMPREEEEATEEKPEYEAHFTPKHIFRAPAMTAMTGGIDPATSFMFPARKYQYDDGTTSWSHEVSYADGRNYVSGLIKGRDSLWPIIVAMILLVVVLSFRKGLKI